ncbi:aspartyl protease family protein [Fluviicoccus keumensis]|uniref:Aspartyl protease family protein n=1 Tax=Fluviicoccus keumensis TaxID=1435465 RepID=A0A4Q7ZB00_9GAMM|nr:TIGR02281 family clan AA aspartic protease [Fluviicoccus keumensis]RZU47750.1 aspartyl protease family protein [Fluviicoccus keumensis]
MVAGRQSLAVLTLLLAATAVHARDIVVVGLMADRAILKVDGETRLIRLGETLDDMTLVGVNASEAKLRIGKREERFTLGQDRGGVRADTSAAATVIISSNAMGQFLTTGMINGRTVEMLVDTGANQVSMTRGQANKLGIDYRTRGQPCTSQTANGSVACWIVLLPRVKVGGIVVEGVDATVRDVDDGAPVLLGMSFLGRLRMEHEDNRLKLMTRQ